MCNAECLVDRRCDLESRGSGDTVQKKSSLLPDRDICVPGSKQSLGRI